MPAALIVVGAALALGVIHFAILAAGLIRLPYGIDYGEGIVWQQLRMIVAGHGYGPIAGFPAIVFHYPPLYHLVSALVAAITGLDQLAAGRLVSAVSMVVAAGMVALLAGTIAAPSEPRLPYRLGGIAAGAMMLTTKPALQWGCLMRVDMLCLALSLSGTWLGIRALSRPRVIHGAALCFVAAIFTKQTALAAPLAVFAILILAHPRTAMAGIATGAITALTGLAVIELATHGGFLHHIIIYNMNRFAPDRWRLLLNGFDVHAGYLVAASWVIVRRIRRLKASHGAANLMARIGNEPAVAALMILLLYLLFATMTLVLVFKSGSSINYFLEWLSLVALFAGLAITEFAPSPRAARRPTGLAAWIVLLLLPVQTISLLTLIKTSYAERIRDRADLAREIAAIRAAPTPVIGDDMVGIIQAGKPVLWEPSIFAELAGKGVWDERPFIALIQQHKFAFFIDDGYAGQRMHDARYSPAVSRAISAAYPQIRYLAQYELHFPAGRMPNYAAAFPTVPLPDKHRPPPGEPQKPRKWYNVT